ncbi:hypothetical protein DC58_13915 [Vibrio navarrensis]|nr:hypothetical protein DC58_13915 [Vibrio navarrensis]
MSKLQQLDVFIGTNTKIGRLILPVGTETEFSFIYEDEWKHTGFPISPHIPFDDQASPRSIDNYFTEAKLWTRYRQRKHELVPL